MPKQVLKDLEREKGDLDQVIPPLVNQFGVVEAARKLKMSAATVGKWLKDNNYTGSMIWQKGVTPQERADIDAQGLPTLEEDEEMEEFS